MSLIWIFIADESVHKLHEADLSQHVGSPSCKNALIWKFLSLVDRLWWIHRAMVLYYDQPLPK